MELTSNKKGYLFLMSSVFHVASEESWLAHRTFTKGMLLLHNCLTRRSKTWIGCFSYDKFSAISMSSGSIIWLGSGTYFRSYEMWKTLWTWSNAVGRFNRYATEFNFSMISLGPMYLGLNLPLTLNLLTPLIGDTFKNTLSPTWNSGGLLWSA